MTPVRTYTPVDPKVKRHLEEDAREFSDAAVHDFAHRVLSRLEAAPRYQSIGREKYVYVADVRQVIDEEMGRVAAL